MKKEFPAEVIRILSTAPVAATTPVVKNLMLGKSSRVQELVSYDNSYMDNLYEVYMHNTRIKRGTVNEDVAVAKLSKAKSKVAEAKSKILKRL